MAKFISNAESLNTTSFDGEVEFIAIDRNGQVVHYERDHNIIKIYAKEILAHRLPHSKIWDITANGGSGGWVSSGIDVTEEFSAKYILLGASFDSGGASLDNIDTRYYNYDSVTGSYVPKRLGVGADYNGGLINSIPLTDPGRPLKRIERIYYQPTYQPAGTPLLQSEVRAMNNVLVLETTLQREEYNGFGYTDSDSFTLTEVALAAGKEFDAIGACELPPEDLFLEGTSDGTNSTRPIYATASGTDTIVVNTADIVASAGIGEGDQVKIVARSGTDDISQITPYYLVTSRFTGGGDIQLDRVPTDSFGGPIIGEIGIFRTSLRIFSHRILKKPFKKTADFMVLVRWFIHLN